MELVVYQLHDNADPEKYRKYIDMLQNALQGEEGFLERRVFYNAETGYWVETVRWENREAAKRCEASLMRQPFMAEAMTLIDTSTLQLHLVHPVLE
ncbi:hypothetical protein ACFSWD_20125 [Paenibacillus xanthanilyticus]